MCVKTERKLLGQLSFYFKTNRANLEANEANMKQSWVETFVAIPQIFLTNHYVITFY